MIMEEHPTHVLSSEEQYFTLNTQEMKFRHGSNQGYTLIT